MQAEYTPRRLEGHFVFIHTLEPHVEGNILYLDLVYAIPQEGFIIGMPALPSFSLLLILPQINSTNKIRMLLSRCMLKQLRHAEVLDQ